MDVFHPDCGAFIGKEHAFDVYISKQGETFTDGSLALSDCTVVLKENIGFKLRLPRNVGERVEAELQLFDASSSWRMTMRITIAKKIQTTTTSAKCLVSNKEFLITVSPALGGKLL